MQIKHGQISKNLALFQNRSTFEGRYGVDSANLLLFLDQYDKRTGTSEALWEDLSGYSISGQNNDIVQATGSYQPSINAGSNRDCDGIDNFMHQEVFDTKVTDVSYTTENSDKTITDSGQDFSDWQTTSGNATYMVVVTDDDTHVSWGYLGAKVSNTEIKVYSDKARTTSAWREDGGTGTPASYVVLKTDFQITAALSVFMWVKPDDGQSGSAQDMMTKYRNVDGFRSWVFYIADVGELSCYLSSDGLLGTKTETTDAAFFSNGQETWHHVGYVYNGSTVVIYGDGVALDSTTGAGGIPSAFYDVSERLTIGAMSTPDDHFAGLIGPTVFASRAYSASEALRLYHGDAGRLSG